MRAGYSWLKESIAIIDPLAQIWKTQNQQYNKYFYKFSHHLTYLKIAKMGASFKKEKDNIYHNDDGKKERKTNVKHTSIPSIHPHPKSYAFLDYNQMKVIRTSSTQ